MGEWAIEALRPQRDVDLARELLDLQHRSYAVEARLIRDTRIPRLHESLADLQQAELCWLGVRSTNGVVVGAIGFSATLHLVDIDRLVVDPSTLRRGVARALVTAVQHRAAGRRVTVSTGRDNAPARRLYGQLGFACTEVEEVLPGLWVSQYESPPAWPL